MNETLRVLRNHRSIRRFTDEPITESTPRALLAAGQSAATSSFPQGVTVIRVTQHTTRERIAEIAGNQAYVVSAPEFLVFCADLHRTAECCAMHGQPPQLGFTEQFIIAAVDVAMFARNVVIGAESIGLGICYIGAIRNQPAVVAELLRLPKDVYPVFGLCLGYPAQDPEAKPRLPLDVVFKQDRYEDGADAAMIREYDEVIRAYYLNRTDNRKAQSWSEQIAGLLGKEPRPHMREFLEARGFLLR